MKNNNIYQLAIKEAGECGSDLLATLKKDDFALLAPFLKVMHLEKNQVLCEPGDAVEYAYFPCGPTLISFMVFLEDARGVEAVIIGREGAAGGIVSHGHLPAYCQTVVQFPGNALRIACRDLERAKEKSVTLHHFFARYADCLLAQMFQSVACNATHTIEQRAAKWISAAHERTGHEEMPLTQEHLASLLGVGRSYVGRVMGGLKAAGAIKTSRGKMAIRDIRKLKSLGCSCNDLVRSHFSDVLAGIYSRKRQK